jgi:hypothetical protein
MAGTKPGHDDVIVVGVVRIVTRYDPTCGGMVRNACITCVAR